MDLKITPSGQTIVKPTALGPVANTDTKLLIYGLFQKGRVLAQDGNTFPAIAVGRLEWSFRFLAGNYQKESKTGHQRAIWCDFGAYRAAFPLNRADNEKTLYA